ncbi:DIP1984 family protein [Corynebacterium aquatimens]|uniref:Mg2+ and Co2+ transporter CorA n=1 Tax=Corynebacterium aquatimens TaxID=1190508 RepID=A0A931E3G3_9CORY|nr:DIP1984 family protein [Corynebacterium aquatimens]MBG6122486.1 Mg2+ and Co2+ transporter CorA [Corynebacterium aquatimens]WJY64974.1 hypothetical protein CAQUA_01175 [Corynebacterium aquatimens]
MLLAEALAQRAEAQDRLNQVTERLHRVARIQEGDQPDEDPTKLLTEADALMQQIEDLVRHINATNSATPFDETHSLTSALALRDSLLRKRRFYTGLADAAGARQDRYSRAEIRYVSTLDVAALRSRADDFAKQFRAIDTRIQQLNWNTELL